MTPELQKTLIDRYPLIFDNKNWHGQHVSCYEFQHGDGWFGLIDALCQLHYAPYTRAKDRYTELREKEGTPLYKDGPVVDAVMVEKARLEMSRLSAKIPVAVQVKEKFGGLRFYADGGGEDTAAYIRFAEAMSYRTCETCGAPGSVRSDKWVRTRCAAHAGS